MAASLTTIRDNLLDAINAIALTGQSYTIGSRTLTRADLPKLLDALSNIEARLRRTTDATAGVRHVEFNSAEGARRNIRRDL